MGSPTLVRASCAIFLSSDGNKIRFFFCKVDFQNANSVQMNNLRTNANAIVFLASGHWRRWTKDRPPGAGSMGR
eukprot:2458518-Rhodomonas_salina.1